MTVSDSVLAEGLRWSVAVHRAYEALGDAADGYGVLKEYIEEQLERRVDNNNQWVDMLAQLAALSLLDAGRS